MQRIFATLALVGATSLVQAATLTVHNTGVDNDANLVVPGAATAFWTLTNQPIGGSLTLGSTPFRYKHPAYAADTSDSAWVSPTAAGNAGALGVYTYTLAVDLTGFDPTTATISGKFTSDNEGTISLNNGVGTASSGYASYGTFTDFNFVSGFVAGLNQIVVTVNNATDPTAFHVQFASATADIAPVPLPGALGLMAGALAGLGVLRRKSRI